MILLLANSGVWMRSMFRMVNLRGMILTMVLGFGVTPQVLGQAAHSGDEHRPADSPAPDHPSAIVHGHNVKLSWVASVPSSKLARDAIVGYNVYRSTTSHDRNPKRINSALCPGTTYIDTEVESGKTYFYVTRGVAANGLESGPSNEAKAKIRAHD
jgi:hypothetical protein